ncbi:hypothetical protein DFQ27_005403 [Actinomortierella ambigua]|uniref:Uncharacterized protein n=1 Tax=Actinomortierella ambigua TaxID=1343610 RepID=A0A9P6Q115_9FUNG|nr:hypothetical protein DFQ27_005403 [Actinomortierella ambigua]
MLSDTTQPLPFQIQRQTDMQGSNKPIASMSLTTVSTRTSTESKSPAGGADGSETVSQQLAQNPLDPNAIKSAAATPAPPFRDLVLAVNDDNYNAQLWHLKAPGRGVPPDSPVSSPPSTRNGSGAGSGTGPGTPDHLPAPLWTATALPQSLYIDAKSVSLGTIHPRDLKEAGVMAVAWKKEHASGSHLVYPLKLVYRRHSGSAVDSNSPSTQAEPSPPSSPLGGGDASNSGNVAVEQPFEWIPAENQGFMITSKSSTPSHSGPVVACTSTKDHIIAIVPGSRVSTTNPQPEIHLFDLKTRSWAKAQLVQAPPGTFSDLPPPPPPGGPSKGDPGGEVSNNPNNESPLSPNETTPNAALIGGIVGGIVVLGAMIFAGFFFYRRRGSKEKAQEQSVVTLKTFASDDTFHEEPRMRHSVRRSRSRGRSPEVRNHHEMAWPQEDNDQVMDWPGANYHQELAWSQANHRQEMPQPQAYEYQRMAQSHVNDHQRMARSQAHHNQEMAWFQANYLQEMAQSQANYYLQEMARSRANNHHEMASSRGARSHETDRGTVPVMHKMHGPQYSPTRHP